MIGSNTNSSLEKCVECGSDILAEHSYCLNCGYRPVKQIISTKQRKLLMLSVFVAVSVIIIMIGVNTSTKTLSNVTNSINHNLNKQINQPGQIDTENNNQETDQVVITDKHRNSILYDSVLNNVLNSEDIVRCGDRYFKIKSKNLVLNLNGYEVIEFKNIKFEYNLRNTDDMNELERLNGLVTEIKYNLSFDYYRNFSSKGLVLSNNKYMIERASWSNWSSTYGSLTNGVYSAYSNKQSKWSHNKNIQTNKPNCDEIIKATDSNYFISKYADRINQLNLLVAELKNLSNFVESTPNYNWGPNSKKLFYSKLNVINNTNCFVADASGGFDIEKILFCRDSINTVKAEMATYFQTRGQTPDCGGNVIGDVNPSTRATYPIKYPVAAARTGSTGTVIVKATYDSNGYVIDTSVHNTSGNRDLDRAAVAGVLRWKIIPGTENCEPVGGSALITVDFTL